ncbi:hypothetical protein PUN4_420018 [Paraburkholderia unamae]|nr:hypothetical protein PUN4_420018 [Paraburkholderia unamae]
MPDSIKPWRLPFTSQCFLSLHFGHLALARAYCVQWCDSSPLFPLRKRPHINHTNRSL